VIERILENWLDNASEKSFQIPFCNVLANEGYQVIHISRHCGMEMGKDIIAISPAGIPCAYQLKGGTGTRITLNQWNALSGQIQLLMINKIIHPSIKTNIHHQSFFVTNKVLEEEVSNAIDQMNRGWFDMGKPDLHLNTIVRGQILEKIKALGSGMLPSELEDMKTFLELYLESGRANLPKNNFIKLLKSVLKINGDARLSREEIKRTIAAGSLVCALSISSFSNEKNHVAVIEAWTLYAIYVLHIAEKNRLSKKFWISSFQIALKAIYDSLGRLCDELIERDSLIEGNPLGDIYFYRPRITLLIAMMSIYSLWRREIGEDFSQHDEFIYNFCIEKHEKMILWGEYCVPQFLAFYWFYRNNDPTPQPDFLIYNLIDTLSKAQSLKDSPSAIPDPYYTIEDLFLDEDLDRYSSRGHSYMIEGLVHLFVRTNWKSYMKKLWPNVTKIAFESFRVKKVYQYYLWHSREGEQYTVWPVLTQHWEKLKSEAFECEGKDIPHLLKQYPSLFLLFICVCPHRAIPESIRWLDSKLFRNDKSNIYGRKY
jgi:hypothetical protein